MKTKYNYGIGGNCAHMPILGRARGEEFMHTNDSETRFSTSLSGFSNSHLGDVPDSKVHGADMGPTWDRQDPSGPHVGPMNFAIWDLFY